MKKFFGKLACLAVIIFVLQTSIGKYDIEFKELALWKQYAGEKTDILYLGDCTDSSPGKKERDKRAISQMLMDFNPHLRISSITHPAYQLDIYLEFCRYIVKQGHCPRVIIIPINLRSFSPQWDLNPHYQFELEKIILRGGIGSRLLYAFYQPLIIFHYDFRRITREEFLNTPVFDGERQAGKMKDILTVSAGENLEKIIRKKLLLSYMYGLQESHRKVKSMLEIARLLTAHHIRLIFYLTPIDIETGERYFPGRFTRQIKRNVDLIDKLLAAQGVRVLDLSRGLGSDNFSCRHWVAPSERLREKGRLYVAQQLNQLLNKIKIE